ncbi:MAG: amidohydrolase family protein [Saprospiraceae bacterium]|nr:amidohydrolase family protein [Candidatus Vicinibacter proximus]MBL7822166.1 amidohydrolase family protein [Saprospiraceae bacterium]MCC6843314.1 amidohydrolase family protein [Saprospiraceae bacterium]HRG33096.1 amidohydrolase family protein [Saprospiraceae bacterium]
MKISGTLFLFIFICNTIILSGQINKSDTTFLIIKNISIIDVGSGKILKKQNVVIKGQFIYYIGNSFSERTSTNTKYIDGKGKYLCPGLWDMHFHLCWDISNDTLLYPALLKNGITGIRDMGGDLKIMSAFKSLKNVNKLNIYGAGPMIDGNPPVYSDFSLPVDNSSDITKLLDSLKNNGSDFFKTYSLLKEAQLKEISAYCRKNDFHFAGHLSEYINPETSISLGQKSIEHLNGLYEIWNESRSRFDSLTDLMLKHHTYICPTIITYQLKTRLRDSTIVNKEYSKYISTSLVKEWKITWGKRVERHKKLEDWDALDKTYLSQLKLISRLHEKGVMLLAGSDFAGMPYVYPGISLHQELKLLTKAGLSNYETLKTATINPAIFMNKQNIYGSVEVEKYADLLILEKNPFDNIENLKTTTFVIVKGKIIKVQNNKS